MLDVSDAYGQDFNTLVACPACGYSFDSDERRHVHLTDHTPADFGLSPIGETDPEAQTPLFMPVSEIPGKDWRTAIPAIATENASDNQSLSEADD